MKSGLFLIRSLLTVFILTISFQGAFGAAVSAGSFVQSEISDRKSTLDTLDQYGGNPVHITSRSGEPELDLQEPAAAMMPTMPDTNLMCNPAEWDRYPYYPAGTDIVFAQDEGQHRPYDTYPHEWWYANFHLTGASGRKYGAFVAFFKIAHMRLFAISDLETGEYYRDVTFAPIAMASDHYLNLLYVNVLYRQAWYNKQQSGALAPFEYRLEVAGRDRGPLSLTADMKALKAPMMVGGNGLVKISDGWSYYTIHPRLAVAGTLRIAGRTEQVTGTGWIDHQWGKFLDPSMTWDWFALQLDDGREILVGDVWIDGVPFRSFSSGLNFYDEACALELLPDYRLTPLRTWTDPNGRTWVVEWRLEEPSRAMELHIVANFDQQVMDVLPSPLTYAHFWEGSCTVSGRIDGLPVTGKAYVELTHATDGP